jgi:hypothetical protein
MVGGEFERREHALADRHARHHHDELAPAVPPVQLEDGLDEHVRLAGARLHLDVEVEPPGRAGHQRR